MEQDILTKVNLPFCPGCGHGPSVKSISKALINSGFGPLDVVMVSDIGCAGLVDPLFNTHTIHGLHGRSPALGLGVSHGLADDNKKVIVIQGDGGATIGLQHILEAARRNANMTLVVLNNLIYGMTGGQVSGLSTIEFKEDHHIDDNTPPFDVVKLAHDAGAVYSVRVTSHRNFIPTLTEAFKTNGFSLVEISSLCQPYGAGKMTELEDWTEDVESLRNTRNPIPPPLKETVSLFREKDILQPLFTSNIKERFGIVLAGSAGGGVQAAGKLLANAAILSGLESTMKGEYPITIGTGFSVAEVIMSHNPINYTGLPTPDIAVILTLDGLNKIKNRLKPDTEILADKSLELSGFNNVTYLDFFGIGRKKGAVLSAITYWMIKSGLLPKESLEKSASSHKYADVLMKTISKTEEELLNAV